MRLTRVLLGAERRFVFATVAERPHPLKQAWMTVATRVPCSGGEEVTRLAVDDVATGLLPVGPHELRASVRGHEHDFELDAVIDIEIEDGGCVRTPVVSQSVPLVAPRLPVLFSTLGVDGNSALSGLSDIVSIRLGAGSWVGPFLLTGELGWAGAECKKALCGETSEHGMRHRSTLSGAAAAHVQVVSGEFLGSFTNATLGARYSYVPVTLPAPGDTRQFGVHGFQAVLGWGVGISPGEPLRHQERGPMLELNVPIGVLYAPGAPEERVAFGLGFEFRILVPLSL